MLDAGESRPTRVPLPPAFQVKHTASAGQFVLLPHGVPHALRPGSTPPPRVLQMSSPGGWERVLEDMFAAGAGAGGPLDAAALNAAAEPHRITYL